jgi:hypothetical protein
MKWYHVSLVNPSTGEWIGNGLIEAINDDHAIGRAEKSGFRHSFGTSVYLVDYEHAKKTANVIIPALNWMGA